MQHTQASSQPIYSTNDPSVFKKLTGNRDVYPQQIKRLERLIDKNPELTKLSPVMVNEKMEVIDGQHRIAAVVAASDKTGKTYPIYYVIVKGAKLSDARMLNSTSKPWGPIDYAQAYASEGNRDYQQFLDTWKKFPLSARTITTFLAGVDIPASEFRDGSFKVADQKKAEKKLQQVTELGQHYPNWPHEAFARAAQVLMNHPNYEQGRMLEQIAKYKEGFNGVPSRARELMPALNMIYNWGRKDKVDLLAAKNKNKSN